MPEKTTGQLIAEGRKRLGLSQEALGERLGVSRQSISKWESDAALPDIAKLVQLSRLYGVTVGALLGVEEPALPSPEGQAPENPSPETIAEEIARAWVARQPKKKRRVLPLLAGGLTAGAVLWFALAVESRLTSLEQSYRSNQSALSQLEHTFSGLPGLVTDILEEQANLTTTHQVAFLRVDPAANAGLFRVSATPREYRPGSEALFTVTDGQQRLATAPAVWQDGVLTGELTIPLTDEFLSVGLSVTGPDGTLYQEELEELSGLRSGSGFFIYRLGGGLTITYSVGMPKGQIRVQAARLSAVVEPPAFESDPPLSLVSVTAALYQNGEKLLDLTPMRDSTRYGDRQEYTFSLPETVLTLSEGNWFGVVYTATDSAGRALHAGEFQVMTGPTASTVEEADSEAILAALFPEEGQ